MTDRIPRSKKTACLALEALDQRVLPDASGTLPHSLTHVLVRFGGEAAATGFDLPGTTIGPAFPLVSGLRQVNLTSGTNVNQVLGAYRADPRVIYAQPDYQIELAGKPNDTSFSSLWGLHNTGQNNGTKDADLDAPEAWDVSTGTGRTIVAVVDSGVDWKHPDLAGNVWINDGEVGGNGIDDDHNGYVDDVRGWDFVSNDNNPMDDDGHGTHVAGIIGAVGNNGIGVAGVLWHVQIMPLKFLDSQGTGYNSDAIRALTYAVANGATISNHSWGGAGYDQALYDAIDAARRAGHVVVAAAGNTGANNDKKNFYPANYALDNVVSVAATDRNDQLASWSNYGNRSVDLAAPGVNILSTTPNNGYRSYSGTSMAAPYVTGVLALVQDLHPNWGYRQVVNQVLTTVDPLPNLGGKVVTGGRLNAASAVGTAPRDATGPYVLDATPLQDGTGAVNGVRLSLSEAIDPRTFTLDDVAELAGPNGKVAATGVSVVSGSGNAQFDVAFPKQTVPGVYRFNVGPDLRDLAGNELDQDRDGKTGETTDDRYLAEFTVTASDTFTSAGATSIIDAHKSVSVIKVDQNFKIDDLNVRIDLDHPYLNDLYVYLRSPGGKQIVLFNRRGGAGDNLKGTTFDDEAATKLTAGSAPFDGAFKPDTALAAVDGASVKGKWQLWVEDKAFGDAGTLKSWALIFKPRATMVQKASGEVAATGRHLMNQAGVVDLFFQQNATDLARKAEKRSLFAGWPE